MSACFTLTLACDQHTEVQRQTRDLQEAQKSIGKVTKELESELAGAKADVAHLEQKLALARQGLTNEVLENQQQLTQALKAQQRELSSELSEATREAEIHGRDTEAALKQLGQTASPEMSNASLPPVDPGQPGQAARAPLDHPDRNEFVPVKGGPDPDPEAALDIEPGTPEPAAPEPAAPRVAVTPNDPPAPVPAPPTITYIPPSDIPPSDTPPSDTPPGDAPPSHSPPGKASPPAPAAPAPP